MTPERGQKSSGWGVGMQGNAVQNGDSQKQPGRLIIRAMSRGISVIIAAHNEGAVIEGTLRSVLNNKLDRPLQIIVVANGCKDDTAEKARRFGPDVEVIETPIGNKINAINLGDRAAKYFPRAFLDADCQLSENLLQRVADEFEDSSVRIVAPGVKYIYSGWNPFLAGYYQLWKSLPHVKRNTMARGFYAIDAKLRERYTEFPALTADDKFIRNLTKPEERRVAEDCYTTVHLPDNFRDLLKVKTRWTFGNLELSERRPDLNVNDQGEHDGIAGYLLARPWLWVNVPTFLFVWWYARRAAKKKLAEKRAGWERDESTRIGATRMAGS
jgi:glycosyltransferase involved in cell wall biosynthesis